MPCKLTTVANENIRVQYVAKRSTLHDCTMIGYTHATNSSTLHCLDSSRDKEQDGTQVFYPGVTTAEIAPYIKYCKLN